MAETCLKTKRRKECFKLNCRIITPRNKLIFKLQPMLGWVGLYGISTIVGYLMPNSVFTYILIIWFVKTFCRYTELNDQTILFQFSMSTKLNYSKYCYVSLTIQLNISHLFTHN